MQTIPILIYGSGGFGREVAWLAEESGDENTRYAVRAFVDDDTSTHGTVVNDIPVMGLAAASREGLRTS